MISIKTLKYYHDKNPNVRDKVEVVLDMQTEDWTALKAQLGQQGINESIATPQVNPLPPIDQSQNPQTDQTSVEVDKGVE